jgi:hypothetical protein
VVRAGSVQMTLLQRYFHDRIGHMVAKQVLDLIPTA